MRASLLVLGALACSTGCASFSTHLTPRPTPPGELEVDGNADVQAYVKDDGADVQVPAIELGVRYGLAPGIDVGGRIGPVHLELDTRIALVSRPSFDLAIVPGLGFIGATRASGHQHALVGELGLPVLAGFRLSPELYLVTGAKILAHLGKDTIDVTEGSSKHTDLVGSELILYPGGLVGLEVILSETFSLLPELNVLFPYLPSYDKFARPVWQGGISFQFHIPS